MAAIAAAHRRALDRPIGLEIGARHHPAACAHGRDDPVGDRPAIECVRAVAGDGGEGLGKVALHQGRAGTERAAVGAEENLGAGGPARQPRSRARQRVRDIVLDRNAVARQRDRRRDQLAEREDARAVFRMREREAGDRAGHADGERGVARLARVRFAPLVEEDVARDRGRRGLAIVDRGVEVAVREVDHHVAAAADIAGARIGHRQRKAGRHRGIDRVAAALQDVDADACRARFLRHHHTVARRDRNQLPVTRGRGIGQRLRRERREPSQTGDERNEHPTGDGHRTLRNLRCKH